MNERSTRIKGGACHDWVHDALMLVGLLAVGQVAGVALFAGPDAPTLTCASPILAFAGSLAILGVFTERLISEGRMLARRFSQPPSQADARAAGDRM